MQTPSMIETRDGKETMVVRLRGTTNTSALLLYESKCTHIDIEAFTVQAIDFEDVDVNVESIKMKVTGFRGHVDRYGIQMRKASNAIIAPFLKSLHIEIYSSCQEFFELIGLSYQHTATGVLLHVTSLTHISFPLVENVFMKGILFQPDFIVHESFPIAYTHNNIHFQHCIFDKEIIKQKIDTIMIQNCYIMLGNNLDSYHLLHISFPHREWIQHKCSMFSTLLEIDTHSFKTRMR